MRRWTILWCEVWGITREEFAEEKTTGERSGRVTEVRSRQCGFGERSIVMGRAFRLQHAPADPMPTLPGGLTGLSLGRTRARAKRALGSRWVYFLLLFARCLLHSSLAGLTFSIRNDN